MYIGSSRQPGDARWKRHLKGLRDGNHHSNHLQNAWNKYGEENFEYIILDKINEKEEQLKREQYWINKYNTLNPEFGYNCTPTADNIGMTEELKERISKTMKGKSLSPEHVAAVAEARRGGHLKESTRHKIAEAHKGRELSEEHKAAISTGGKGKKKSEETKQRMREAALNRSAEHRRKISEANKGKKKSRTKAE